jgi:hypothetical protein
MNKIELLYQSGQTVFDINDLRLRWQENNSNSLKSKIKYYVDRGRIFRIKKGIYSLAMDYDPLELSQKLLQPSYISLHTALAFHQVVFQPSREITALALYWRSYSLGKYQYVFHTLKDEIFYNPLGILQQKNYWIASRERAITDTLYLFGETFFDNTANLDKNLLSRLAQIYCQKTTHDLIQKLIKTL